MAKPELIRPYFPEIRSRSSGSLGAETIKQACRGLNGLFFPVQPPGIPAKGFRSAACWGIAVENLPLSRIPTARIFKFTEKCSTFWVYSLQMAPVLL